MIPSFTPAVTVREILAAADATHAWHTVVAWDRRGDGKLTLKCGCGLDVLCDLMTAARLGIDFSKLIRAVVSRVPLPTV